MSRLMCDSKELFALVGSVESNASSSSPESISSSVSSILGTSSCVSDFPDDFDFFSFELISLAALEMELLEEEARLSKGKKNAND